MPLHFWRQGKSHSSEGGDPWQMAHEAEQEAIREMAALRAQGEALRAIATARISHELRNSGPTEVCNGSGLPLSLHLSETSAFCVRREKAALSSG
jgi:hypothetical protein